MVTDKIKKNQGETLYKETFGSNFTFFFSWLEFMRKVIGLPSGLTKRSSAILARDNIKLAF